MFTGIIHHCGRVTSREEGKFGERLTIASNLRFKPGDSIAVDGVCLTISRIKRTEFTMDVMPETLQYSIIKTYDRGTVVNLERPLKFGEPVNGHFVLGHTDGVGTVTNVLASGKYKNLAIQVPLLLMRFCAQKGSIAINGVGLTIAKKRRRAVEVACTPYTLAHTNLAQLKTGDTVNIEIDVMARYLYHAYDRKMDSPRALWKTVPHRRRSAVYK